MKAAPDPELAAKAARKSIPTTPADYGEAFKRAKQAAAAYEKACKRPGRLVDVSPDYVGQMITVSYYGVDARGEETGDDEYVMTFHPDEFGWTPPADQQVG